VTVVVVFDPQRSAATVYRAGPPEETLNRDDLLTFPEVLPGFSVRVGQFFE
jgi:Uma2 family endonuclease